MVIYGVPEAVSDIAASLRQEHTEKAVMDILDELDIEARPVEIYRVGKFGDKPSRVWMAELLRFQCAGILYQPYPLHLIWLKSSSCHSSLPFRSLPMIYRSFSLRLLSTSSPVL
ncbi:unnamed protein product [Haemonchus placei]|uniref:Ras-associating domain-containing protein n=1 Tax=Haemonchus placei TaxID=6290 RepID=A0A0N4WJY1_HAEPC|nr:unnamed protein product [Haemonchus placei]